MQWCEWPMNLMSFDWLRWLLSVFQWVIAWLACQMMLISGQSTILLILYVTVLLLMHVVTVWVLLSLFIHSSLFAQKFRQIQREAKEHSWTKRSLNTDIRPWTTNMLIIKLMTMHKTRKINIAYRSSKWWQWCETDSWWQTVPEIYHTFSIKILPHTTGTWISLGLVKTLASTALTTACFLVYNDEPIFHHKYHQYTT